MPDLDTCECEIWQGSLQSRNDSRPRYGIRRVKGRKVYVHRWAWEQAHGPIPPGMMVLHHCDNPVCIRMEHLYLGTAADNARDREVRGRGRPGPGKPFRQGFDPRRNLGGRPNVG